MGKTGESFGERVKRLRKSLGLKQPGLAEKSGLSIQMIKDIERGRSPGGAKSYRGLSKALGISVEELLEGENPEPNKVIIKLPTSAALKRALSIPDRVYELAEALGPDHPVWKNYVLPALENAEETERSRLGKKSV